MKVWTDRVGTTLIYRVALSTTGLEQFSTGSTGHGKCSRAYRVASCGSVKKLKTIEILDAATPNGLG
jgi:hypothetical protein